MRKIDYKKFVVFHEACGKTFANGFLLPDHYNHSLDTFKDLAREAKKSFPNLKDNDIDCRSVVQSSWVKGFPIIRFPLPADVKVPEDWSKVDRLPDIQW